MLRLWGVRILLALILAHTRLKCFAAPHLGRGICATAAPDELLKAEFRRLRVLESQRQAVNEYENRYVITPIEIDTWFHIVNSEANADFVSDDMIATQLAYLQEAYRDASITYRLQGVTRQINDLWARNGDEMAMKNALRKGSYRTLNVYFQSDLQASRDTSGRVVYDVKKRATDISQQLLFSVLGFCTLPDPEINSTSPRSSYVKDGCNVLSKTMPGGPLNHYNKGGTAIHEIGHWNGLLHTFEGESCSPDNDGDYITDTPQESIPTEGCPILKNSCPDLPGIDAVHNFMDYSSDDCYESFTPDQARRMQSMWYAMREGK